MHRDDLPVLKELLSQTVDPIEVISVSFSLRAVKVNMAITLYCTKLFTHQHYFVLTVV